MWFLRPLLTAGLVVCYVTAAFGETPEAPSLPFSGSMRWDWLLLDLSGSIACTGTSLGYFSQRLGQDRMDEMYTYLPGCDDLMWDTGIHLTGSQSDIYASIDRTTGAVQCTTVPMGDDEPFGGDYIRKKCTYAGWTQLDEPAYKWSCPTSKGYNATYYTGIQSGVLVRIDGQPLGNFSESVNMITFLDDNEPPASIWEYPLSWKCPSTSEPPVTPAPKLGVRRSTVPYGRG